MQHSIGFSNCVALEVLIACSIAISTSIGSNGIPSFLFALSFIVILIFTFLNYRRFYHKNFLILFTLVCFINVILSGLFQGGNFTFDYFKKVIMFTAFMVFLNAAGREGFIVSPKIISVIEFSTTFAGFFLVVSYMYLGNTATMAGCITLGFTNPNFAGMWLLHFFLYGCLFVLRAWRKSKFRLLYIPVLVKMAELINLTGARSCFLGVLAFFALLVLGLRGKKINRVLLMCIAIIPLVGALVYLCIAETIWFLSQFDFMVSEGKSITSRVVVWNNAIEWFRRSPIWGSYSGLSYGLGQSQAHNTHIDVMASYGVFVVILYIINLYQNMASVLDNSKSFYQYAAFAAFVSTVIMGCFEAAVVSGAMGMNLLTVGLFVLANYEWNTSEISYE